MDIDNSDNDIVEKRLERYHENDEQDCCQRSRDAQVFLKGMIIGFGLAAVASAAFGLFRQQSKRRKYEHSAGSRIQRYDESGNILGDLSNIIDESTCAFRDAVHTLDQTFETGRQALDTFGKVVDKMREQ